jgi:outer membrane biosynthesis protein TonB
LSTLEESSAGRVNWLARSSALVVSLLVHTALFLWLLTSNLAGDEVVLPSAPLMLVELVKIPPPPPPPPPPEIKNDVKPDKKPLPKRAAAKAAPPKEDPGPPAHEISTKDDEWVAPRVNNNKSFVIGARRVPSDYAEKVKSQVVANTEYPADAVYKPPKNYKGDLKDFRQQCVVDYEITVDRNGNMLSYKYEPCGNAKLDAAADAGLRKSGPFPPPPNLGAESYVIYGTQIFRVK